MTVLIATPCYGGQMTVGFFRTCMGLRDDDVDFLVTEGESHVTRARNNLCATFLKSDCDVLAFIDADIELKPEDFRRLAKMPGVRGAAVAMKHPNGESLSCFADGKQLTRAQMPREPFCVDFLGSAVLFIDKAVLRAMTLSSRVTRYDDPIVGEAWDFFRDGVSDGTWLSEDYGFCAVCNSLNVPIWCDPSVIVKHYGTRAWEY